MKKQAAFLLVFAVLLPLSPDVFAHGALSFSPSTVYAHNLNGSTITISRTSHTLDNGYLQAGSISISGLDGLSNGGGTLLTGNNSVRYTLTYSGNAVSITSPTAVTITGKGSGTPRIFYTGGAHSGTLTVNPTPRLSIDSPRVSEGNSGETMMTFTVSLSPASTQQVTVEYELNSSLGTATILTDFAALSSGTLTFAAGEPSKTFTVMVTGDTTSEPNETVVVGLSNPSNAVFAGGASTITGTGTIVDDDRVLSSDSSLSSLVLSTGELSPSFSSSTLSYTATVDRSVDQLTVTPTANTAVSGIRVNKQRVSSGSASRSIDLSFGENPISVLVLAENLSYRVYNIVVTREMADRTPDEFSFAARSDADPGATVTSEAITVAGLGEGESADISVSSGGTLIVDGSEFSGTTVTNGQRVAVAVVASGESGGTATATVTIGGVSANFTVTTLTASSDANLGSLSLSPSVDLSPSFDSSTQSYTATVPGRITSVTVSASPSRSGASVAITPADSSSEAGHQVSLNEGLNPIAVVVTAADGTQKTYRIAITRTATQTASSNANLRSLSFSPAISLSPSFTGGTAAYTATVSSQISTLTISATPAHSGASVNFSPADASASITGHQMNLNAGLNTATIVVTAEDNSTRKTYRVAITRIEATPTQAIKELDREIVTEVSREVASSTLQAITGRISNVVANVPVAVPTTGSATSSLLPILEIFNRHDRDASSTRSTLHQSLDGANFVLSLANGEAAGSMQVADDENGMAPGGVALWGAADYRNMSGGKNSTVNWDGGLFSVHVGSDALLDSGMLIGLSASVSRGSFDYSGGSRNTRGQLKTRMTSLHPYLGWTASERLNLWMTVGYGQGKIEYNDSGSSPSASDTSLTTTAFGSRYRLNDGDFRMLDESVMVDLKTEAWGTRLTVKGNEVRQEKTSIRTHGLRLAIEGSQERNMETGATVTPFGELGVRWDGGAGDTGTGLELGGGLKLLAPCRCQTLNASARYLALHESGRKEWGIGMSIRRDLNYDRTGMSYGASLSHGETGSEVETLWESSAAGREDEDNRLATRVDAEVGYGLYGADGIYTPYAGLGLVDDGSRDYAVGIRYTGEAALSLGLEISRFEKTDKSPDHRIMLTGQVDW